MAFAHMSNRAICLMRQYIDRRSFESVSLINLGRKCLYFSHLVCGEESLVCLCGPQRRYMLAILDLQVNRSGGLGLEFTAWTETVCLSWTMY